MPVPRIAIIGRPNVGKSSLMNMLAKDKVSIVDPTPGVTRDRVSFIIDLEGPDDTFPERTVELTDTGGFGVYTAEGRRYNEVGADLSTLTEDIEFQISQAVAHADLVLFVIDAQAGITPQDETIARLLRERVLGGKRASAEEAGERGGRDIPVVVVANKTDGPKWEAHAYEAAALGFGEPWPVSAKNNYFRRDFVERLYAAVNELPAAPDVAGEEEGGPELKIAIVGKRNAGKSTLVNTLAGEERVIVSEIAGTTRDAIDVRFEFEGRTFLAIDTAGLRKKKSFADRVEWFAYDRAQRAIDRSDVVLLLLDATEPISQVDQQLAALVQKAYRPCVVVVNKWDLAEGKKNPKGQTITVSDYQEYIQKELKGLDYAPISFISAEANLNVHETIDLAFQLGEQARQRVGTGVLNRLVRRILEQQGPSSKLGTFVKPLYVAQVAVAPPTIVLVVNRPELFTPNYERFLMNRFREVLPFQEVPIKLIVKGRKREEDEETREEAEARAGAGVEGGFAEAEAGEDALADLPEEAEAFFEDEER